MASPHASSSSSSRAPAVRPARRPNAAFRRLRGPLSPGEFAAAVRRAARNIGEQVSCDARYIGRVESGEIRCPNYAYERVFRHMFPDLTLVDMGFAPRETVRGRGTRSGGAVRPDRSEPHPPIDTTEESDVLRRAFMTGGPAAVAAASLGLGPVRTHRPAGESDAAAVEEAVRRIRVLDDRHGADGLYRRAAQPLKAAYALLKPGAQRQSTADRLQAGFGELALSVGWLAHDSGLLADARSHYAEALATARIASDPALEAHAFCNTAFLARDADRPREAVGAAQAAQSAAGRLPSSRLMSLLVLREAGGWAGLGDRRSCEDALLRAHSLFGQGPSDADPEWMSFFGEAELEGLEAQCWSALGEWKRAVDHARRATALQDPHFTRNTALFTAELAGDLVRAGAPEEASDAGGRVLGLLDEVQSSRILGMLAATARLLRPYGHSAPVAEFLERCAVRVRWESPTAGGAAAPGRESASAPV